MKKNLARSIVPCMLIGFAGIASAANLTVVDASAFIDNRGIDDPLLTGLNLNLEVVVEDSVGGAAALTALTTTASFISSNLAYNLSTDLVCCDTLASMPNLAGFGATPVGVTAGILPTLAGTYTFTVTDANGTVTGSSHNLDYLVVLDLPTNIGFSDTSPTPVVTFTDPNALPPTGDTRGYLLKIYDSSFNKIYESSPSFTTPSFGVPDGVLQAGQLYHIRAELGDADTAELMQGGFNALEDRAVGWTTFAPVPIPGTLLLLGTAFAGTGVRCRRRRG